MGMGKILGETLAEKGIKVSELSNKTGIPRSTLYSIIKRDSLKIDPNHLTTICNALNVPVSQFFGPATVFDSPEEFNKVRDSLLTDEPQGIEYKTSYGPDSGFVNEVIDHDRNRLETALADCVKRLDNESLEELLAIAEVIEKMQNKRKGQTK